jgi:hypothetical protein
MDYDDPNAVDDVIRTYLTSQIMQDSYAERAQFDPENASLRELALFYRKNLDQPLLTTSEHLDYVGFERGRVAELLDAMRGEYDRSIYPDASLLLMVGQILWEPADWVITGIEIRRQLEERDYLGAGVNATLLAAPILGSWVLDLLKASSRVPNTQFLTTIDTPTSIEDDILFYRSYPQPRPIRIGTDDPIYALAQNIRSESYMSTVLNQGPNLGVLQFQIDDQTGSMWAISGSARRDAKLEAAALGSGAT